MLALAQNGHAQLPPLLTEAAAIACPAELKQREDWVQVVNSGNKVFDLTRSVRAAISPAQLHKVSMATGSVPSRHYSIAGWLRAKPQLIG